MDRVTISPTSPPLDVVLDAWDRSNTILVQLLRALPPGGLEARAAQGSPSVSQMFMHMHHERMVSLSEEAPEFAGDTPIEEWATASDPERIARLLEDSAARVRSAVRTRTETGRALDLGYDHPILLLQLLMFHEAYHHGQIKIALKVAGMALADEVAGPITWGVWRRRRQRL